MQSFKNASLAWSAVALAAAGVLAGAANHAAPVAAVSRVAVSAVEAVAAVKPAALSAAAAVAAVTPASPPAIRMAAPAAAAAIAFASDETLHAKIRWIPVRYGDQKLKTLDVASRLLLAQAAAERADLDEVGLTYEDVYGVINAETSWIPRTGLGKTGTRSHGLAQFEPGTAKGLGLKDPNDPVQAVTAAAVNMKHGAEWAEAKIAHLNLTPEERAEKIREGVSIYYNLSIRGRNKWDGVNTAELPVETQRHISNVRRGAERASELAEDLVS